MGVSMCAHRGGGKTACPLQFEKYDVICCVPAKKKLKVSPSALAIDNLRTLKHCEIRKNVSFAPLTRWEMFAPPLWKNYCKWPRLFRRVFFISLLSNYLNNFVMPQFLELCTPRSLNLDVEILLKKHLTSIWQLNKLLYQKSFNCVCILVYFCQVLQN